MVAWIYEDVSSLRTLIRQTGAMSPPAKFIHRHIVSDNKDELNGEVLGVHLFRDSSL